MKTPLFCIIGFALTISTASVAQIDIYQSDAYSVEEMCAREAEQNTSQEYTHAYESCLKKNRDKPEQKIDPSNASDPEPKTTHSDNAPDKNSR